MYLLVVTGKSVRLDPCWELLTAPVILGRATLFREIGLKMQLNPLVWEVPVFEING